MALVKIQIGHEDLPKIVETLPQFTRVLLAVGAGILTYELLTKMQKLSKDFFAGMENWHKLAYSFSTAVLVCLAQISTANSTFVGLVLAYAAASLLMWRSESTAIHLPGFMTDMVEEAKEGKFISMIGYEDTVNHIEIILNTRNKTNAILLAHAGVGKTSIPETIAYKIAHNLYSSGDFFAGAKIIRVDFIELLAGTKFVGTIEERVREMINIAKKDPTIIYFIDEIYMLVGGGRTFESNVDVSKLLFPAMARGEIRILGASTFADYNRYIKPNGQFARRLPPVIINEPTQLQCYTMLKHSYHHICQDRRIKVADQAIAAAIFFTAHIQSRFYPDKAIDIIATAVSAAELKANKNATHGLIEVNDIAESYIRANGFQNVHPDTLVGNYRAFIGSNPDAFPGITNDDVD